MTMTMVEFIEQYYPIQDKIDAMNGDYAARIMEADGLPCDCVMMIDGRLQKAVEISSDNYVSVEELLSYTEEDVEKLADEDFKKVYKAYMSQVDVTDITLESIMSAVRDVKANQARKRDVLECIS